MESSSVDTMPTPDRKGSGGRRKGRVNSGMCCIRMTLITFNLATGLTGVCIVAVGLMLLSSTFQQYLGEDSGNDAQLEGEGDLWINRTQDVTVSFRGESGFESINEIPETHEYQNPGDREFTTLIVLCMTFGTLMTFISFLGCFGACINSPCLLMTYVLSVVVTVIFQLFISVFAIVYRDPVSNFVREELRTALKKDYHTNNVTMETWDHFQIRFGCCGVDSFSDWFDGGNQVRIVPDSCCLDVQPGCGRTDPTLWQKRGCLAQIQYFTLEHLHILAFFIVGIVFLQLYGIIASTLLYYHIKTPKGPQTFKAYRYERANMS